jgi:uncharacterized protein (TIGR02117 family)
MVVKIRLQCLRVTLFTVALLTIGYFTPRKWVSSQQGGCNFSVCVQDTGIHTNILVPVHNQLFDWHRYLALENIGSEHSQYNYLSFGWGDRDFYMQTPTLQNLDLLITFKALFVPTHSVMYVQGYQTIPPSLIVKCVKVNSGDYLRLMNFIDSTFKTEENGKKLRIGDGHHPNGGFYAANGSYSILRNCNSWTASGLRKADVNTPLWDGLSSAIMWQMRSGCD